MDFHLSKEQEMIRKMYREFAETEVKPLAEELDEEERFPMETVEKMAKLGMMGIYFPKQYGGAGGDVLSYAMCVEELAKVCGTTAVIVSAHTSLCCAPIFEHGTEEQKMKYLPDLLSGKKIGAFGLTEPNAGTDASGQQTMACLLYTSSPKAGTVTMDVTKAVNEIKAGKVEYRLDKTNIIHCPIGKVSFGAEKLSENFNAIMGAIVKAKPAAAKGQYIKSCVVASTMGPGVKVNGAKLM